MVIPVCNVIVTTMVDHLKMFMMLEGEKTNFLKNKTIIEIRNILRLPCKKLLLTRRM